MNRNRGANGQYDHDLNVVCTCGRRKGEHDAEPPYAHEDNDCEEFIATSARRARGSK